MSGRARRMHRDARGLRRIALAVLVGGTTAAAPAAVPQPVHWQVTAAPHGKVKPGQKFDITLSGRIDPGWHVYALEEPDGGPVATEVALAEGDPADLLRVTSGRPDTLTDPQFGMQTALFVNAVTFTLHLRGPAHAPAAEPATLHALIRYQSCDSHVCLPPHTDTVPVPVAFTR